MKGSVNVPGVSTAELAQHTGDTTIHVTAAEKAAWNDKQAALTFDSSPTSGSGNPVESGGVYTALDGKQDSLTFDSTPTSGSTNPVTSGGVYTALQNAGGASVLTGTATIPVGTSWTGPDDDTGLYTYTVAISGMTAGMNAHVTPIIDVTDADTGNAQQDAWDTHYWSQTVAGGIKFYAAEQPGVAVQFAWEVIQG